MFPSARSKSRQRGSILVFTTFVIPLVLVPLVGLAIDATMLRIVQARLSAAVDGAALGAGRLLGTSATPASMATEFVKANFITGGTGFWGATNLQITTTYTPGITKTIAINATAQVPLLFSRIFGQSLATVAAAGTATRTDSRIMLVIDRSGSMNQTQSDGNSALTDAINDAVEFTQSFTAGTDEVGLVVFDGSAYVAYPNYAPGTYSVTPTASGGPDTAFNTIVSPATVGPMVNMLQNTLANNGSTNTSEALWLAYVELQKAHLRDTKSGNTDTRLNAIVLMTDGLPQSVTVYPNNVTNYPTNYFMASSGSSCTNLYNSHTMPNPPAIIGFMIVPASFGAGANTFTSQVPFAALYQLASTDSTAAHTASWWVGSGAGQTLTMNPNNAVNCKGLFGTTGSDFSQIPNVDNYGNTMNSSAYLNSVFVDSSGNAVSASNNPILANGHIFNKANVYKGIDWVQAQWNAADSAGQRIRSDVNLINRTGDTQLPIYIYTIGFLGDGGADQGLLARIANDKTLSSSYDSSTLAGNYYPATNSVALHNAFETVAATILRLAK
jgi:uncharacterized protein YegL